MGLRQAPGSPILSPRTGTARRGRGRDGFLLPETLATFTISAFVLLGLVSSASVLLHAVDGSVARVERVDDLGRALDAIARDVSALKRARWNGTEPQPFVFRGGSNSLYFAHADRSPDGTSAMKVVALREIVTGDGPRLVRSEARLSARAASFDDLLFGPPREIWTGAARLRFAYLPQDRDATPSKPVDTWPIGTQLPEAVLLEAVDRVTKAVIVTARITIRADADIGCLDDGDTDKPNDPAAAAAAATAPSTPASTAGSGITFGDIPPAEALPAPTQGPATTAQAAHSEPFCGRLDNDKKRTTAQAGSPTAPQTPVSGPIAQGPTP